MFGSVIGYTEQDYLEAHPVLYLITEAQSYRVEVYACRTVSANDLSHFEIAFADEDAYMQYVSRAVSQSYWPAPFGIERGYVTLTLVTCSTYSHDDNPRVLVQRAAGAGDVTAGRHNHTTKGDGDMKHARIPALLALLLAALLAAACSGQAGAPQGAQERQPEVGNSPQLPETVTFQCGAAYSLDAEEVAVALAAGETALLERLAGLRVAEVTGSADYEELAVYAAAPPGGGAALCRGGRRRDDRARRRFARPDGRAAFGELERVLAVLPLLPALEEVNLNRMAGAPVPDGADAALYAGAAEDAKTPEEDAGKR